MPVFDLAYIDASRLGSVATGKAARTSPDDTEPERRGITSIQLFRTAEHGWRIVHMIWDNERG